MTNLREEIEWMEEMHDELKRRAPVLDKFERASIVNLLTTQLEAAEKRAMQNKKVEIQETLHAYSEWLEKHNYMDSDWYAEPPNAVDRFLSTLNPAKG